ESVAARAIEFITLTAVRSGEAIGATWAEIDFAETTWVVPPFRMKSGIEFRVPLSPAAFGVIEQMARIRQSDFIFPGISSRTIAQSTLLRLLKDMDCGGTIHGMRSCFATWASERTGFAAEIREASLAHQIGSLVERAYRRGDFFNKRRQLLEAWGKFCTTPPREASAVVPIRRGGA